MPTHEATWCLIMGWTSTGSWCLTRQTLSSWDSHKKCLSEPEEARLAMESLFERVFYSHRCPQRLFIGSGSTHDGITKLQPGVPRQLKAAISWGNFKFCNTCGISKIIGRSRNITYSDLLLVYSLYRWQRQGIISGPVDKRTPLEWLHANTRQIANTSCNSCGTKLVKKVIIDNMP